MQAVPNTWYVQVGGQAYGPYSPVQMQCFVTEGRISAQSMISQNAWEGYALASQFPIFGQWSAQGRSKQQAVNHPEIMPQAAPQTQILRPMSNVGGGVLARAIQPSDHAPQSLAPTPRPVQRAPSAPQPQVQPAANTVIFVMAEIRSANGMTFLQALQQEGKTQRIGDSVWLLRSGISVEHLRNRLSQTLTRDDRLFLLDSFKNETAWFNIGSDMDVRIRELWDMES